MTNDIQTLFTAKVKIAGVEYQVSARLVYGRKSVKALVGRVQEDGSTVWAHMAARQHKAEAIAIGRFASEIEAAFAAVGL